jgi:Tol biopolymer transport system component
LFPGTIQNWRADKPITPKVVWDACREAATRAQLEKRVSPHLLMLTGEQLFRGETITDVLAAIVNSEPDLSKVSPRAQRLIRACLEKDARHRLQAIGDAWLLLESGAKTRQGGPHLSWGALLVALSVGIVAIAAAGMWARWRQPTVERRPLQFQVHLPEGVRLVEGTSGGSALSPDGRTIAVVAMAGGVKRLWLRPFDSLAPRELTGTSGADFPFWSPDGRSIGFFAEGKLKRVDSSGGQPIVLAEAPVGRGGAWASDGTIIFAGSTGVLQRVSADTGPTTPVTKLNLANGENAHRWPQFLPDERRFLYWVRSSKPNRSGVYASSLDRPQDAVLVIANATNGLYSAPQGATVGYLLWARENQIVAQMFDPEHSRLSGEPTVIAGTDGVGLSLNAHHASFSLSQEGTLLFAGAEDRFQLELFGRNGQRAGDVGGPEHYAGLRISPDGRRVAVALYDSSATRDIWTMELARGLLNRLPTNGGGFVPIWSPDGHQIAYHDLSQMGLITIAADGSDRHLVLDSQEPVYINDWSPDGGSLLFTRTSQTTLNDLWRLPLAGDRKPVQWLATQFNESHGQYSPNGKWIAFTADDSGQQEVYMRGVAARDRVRVSSTGGSFARWRADGKELFYRSTDGRLMAVPVSPNDGHVEFGTPVALMDIVEPLGNFAYPVRHLTRRPENPDAEACRERAPYRAVDRVRELGCRSEEIAAGDASALV